MKATRARWCALFPWLFRSLEMNTPKDRSGGTKMVELRGLGKVAAYERAGLSYTSLRDVMAAQKRKQAFTTEADGLGLSVNNSRPRSPKSRLLEKAARAWLQPTVCDQSLQQSNFFSRYWFKFTKETTHNSPATLSRCVLHLPFLKCLVKSPTVEPKTFLCY